MPEMTPGKAEYQPGHGRNERRRPTMQPHSVWREKCTNGFLEIGRVGIAGKTAANTAARAQTGTMPCSYPHTCGDLRRLTRNEKCRQCEDADREFHMTEMVIHRRHSIRDGHLITAESAGLP